ncbi:DUF3533 domain-containing protein [Bailinhaonella thermotolerans]|uniref:DUF3533 domain-containing protein n=1 Tax=Bailinhaonella thermotolerans TaxID=1070861 RepID=A0A3A4A3L9_9ACTN|nr:DUF3533 domain-containing protein [Bailinhaonella thermotolerans]RJL21445.1 DUF3533 domain-containing protein [Bailinhaonella thermotolerans]
MSRGRSLAAELRDAVRPRAVLLVAGVFVLQLGFILSYVGAFHSPSPHRIPVDVVAPPQVSRQLVDRLDNLPGHPVRAHAAPDEATARRRLLRRETDAVYVVNPRGTTDTLLAASAAGPAVTQVTAELANRIGAGQGRHVRVDDVLPPAPGDGRGLSSFYLVIGWMVGGYLAAAIIGVAASARPANPRRAAIRLGALAVYAIVSGLGGAVVVGPVLGALPGHFWQVAAIGALLVFAVAAATTALQVLLGLVGIGVAILFFVILGNPSAGGPYPASLLPPFWAGVGPALPPGAGTTAVRNTVYFAGHGTAGPLWVLAAYALGGVVVAVIGSALRRAGRPPRHRVSP